MREALKHDIPSGILLIAAETVADGKAVIKQHGFSADAALGRVRIVTEPHGLRGWRPGTPVFFSCAITAGDTAYACLSDSMIDALDAYARKGVLRPVNLTEASEFLKRGA